MDTRFSIYNTHWHDPAHYWQQDHHLRLLKQQPYCYHHPLIDELPRSIPGIYTIGGGRQIGKTTLLKQWIAVLIDAHIPATSITFYTGELIDNHHALVDLLQNTCSAHPNDQLQYIIIDEITYIKNWDKGIKFMADAGYFDNCIVVLTGSDLILMQAARMTFPGRRGIADKVDFHVFSLSFYQFLVLKKIFPDLKDISVAELDYYFVEQNRMKQLYTEFNLYLQHGGYLVAINDIARDNCIKPATLKVYADWIRGDMLKYNKQETYLRELVIAIINRYNKQVSWHSLADALSIDSHKTIADYAELLQRMDALFIQKALLIDKLAGAPKKARKLTFSDPFIYHALKQWLWPEKQPFQRIMSDSNNAQISADLVEAVVSNHINRYYPTYYIKASNEIDIAYVRNNRYWPIEIKWRNHLRPKDIKGLLSYQNVQIFAKALQVKQLNGLTITPLPLALLKLCLEFANTNEYC